VAQVQRDSRISLLIAAFAAAAIYGLLRAIGWVIGGFDVVRGAPAFSLKIAGGA
jgi:hypothetical protein